MDLLERRVLNILLHLLAILKYLIEKEKKISSRRWWTKPHLHPIQRSTFGAYSNLFCYFRLNDHEEFYRYIGMTPTQFTYLYQLVKPYLIKRSKREFLSPVFRLVITLK